METSSTYPKFSFLRFLYTFVLVPLLLVSPGLVGEVMGQTPTYATWTPNSGVIPRGVLGAGGAGVTNPTYAANDSETQWAQLRAQQVAVLVPVSGGGAYIQLKFEEELAPGTTTFIKISDLDASGISLGVLGLLGLDGEGVSANAYTGATNGDGNGNPGTLLGGAVTTHSLVAEDGSRYIAVTPSSTETYNSVRLNLNIPADVPVLDLVRYDLDVYYAFKANDVTCGLATYADEGRATGVNLNVLNTPLVANPGNAIDGNLTTFSQVSFGNLSVSVGSAVQQTFYYHGLSERQDYFKVTLAIDGGVLDLGVLGNYEIKAYDGNDEVFSTMLQSALINNLDLLGLLESGQPVTLTFGPGVPFDRISVGINNVLGASLASSPLNIYSVERYGVGDSPLTCTDPDPFPTPDPTDPMLIQSDCEATVIDFDYANFPYNAVDGNNDTYTTLQASSGIAAGIDAYDGFIELGFDQRTGGTTTYVRIDFDDDVLLGLLDGSVGQLLGNVVDDVLFGSHYFTVEAKQDGTGFLEASSNNGFGNAPVKIVQDKNGHYYVAVTPTDDYNSIRITESLGALLGLGEVRTMNVYHACTSTGADICEQAFATYSESDGINLDLLGIGGAGVIDAHYALTDDVSTSSEIDLGAAGIGASVFQFVQYHTLSAVTDHFNLTFSVDAGSVADLGLLSNIEVRAYAGDEEVFSQKLSEDVIDLDLLGLLQSGEAVMVRIAPGIAFDRIAIGKSALVDVNVLSSPLYIHKIERFGADCPDPDLEIPDPTDDPFNTPGCAEELVSFDGVNFAYNATDSNNETFATLTSGTGVAAEIGGYNSHIELGYVEPVDANTTSYIRINFEEDMLKSLLGGTLGKIVGDVLGGVVLGNHYFIVDVNREDGSTIVSRDSRDQFGDQSVKLVQDAEGRFYIAVTADEEYQSVRITHELNSIVGLGKTATLDVYNMCHETAPEFCDQARFVSFDGDGISLSLDLLDITEGGVLNPHYVIDENTSNYSTINLGVAGVGATIYQNIYFNGPSKDTDKLRLRVQLDQPGLLNLDLIGSYRVKLFLGEEEVYNEALQDGLLNNIDLLALLNSGGIQELTLAPEVVFDRVQFGLESIASINTGAPLRLYEVSRISEDCPDPTFEEPPFVDPFCATELIDAENVDNLENLFNGNHNSYATIRSDAGLVGGIFGHNGFVELGYGTTNVDGGITSFIRIDTDETLLETLLSGSLGEALSDIVGSVILGHHYFEVEVKDASGNPVVSGSSANMFSASDGAIKIVQDAEGRYYLAITPTAEYNSIRITDNTNSVVGLNNENSINVYGLCHETNFDGCAFPFTTSFDGSGLSVDLTDLGGYGVTDAYKAIDPNNTSDYSEISLGALNIAGSVEQKVQFNKALEANTVVNLDMAIGTGVLAADVFGRIEVVGYNNGEEVYAEDLENAVIGNVNLVQLFNNGAREEISFAPDVEVDEVGLRLRSIASVAAVPNVRLYSVEIDCTVPQFVAWKSFEINEDPALTSVSGGETVEYTIHVRNTGGVDIEDYIITDVIPEYTTFVESADGTVDGGVVTFTGINVPVDGTATVSFTITVDENLTGVSEIFNVALVKADEDDEGRETLPPSPTDPNEPDEDSDEPGTVIPVDPVTGLVSWKAYTVDDDATITSVSGGETVEYTIFVRNTGNQDLTNVVVSDVLPEGVEHAAGGDLSGNTVTFEIDELAVGETSDPLVFSVTVNEDLTGIDVIRNVATVVSDEISTPEESFPPVDNENPTDPDDTGDTGTEIPVEPINTLVSWKAYEVNGDISITSVSGGETIEYTIFVRNTGNQDLTNVEISDELPVGVTHVSGGTLTGNTVSFTIPTLAVGATSIGQTFTVEVDEDLTGIDVIRNVAVVGAEDVPPTDSYPPVDNENPEDPDDTGDTGTEIPVEPLHSVEFSKNGLSDGANNGQAQAGDIITYTLTVTNTGNKALSDVVVTDEIPANTTLNGAGDFTNNGGTLEATIATLDVNEEVALSFTVEVDAIDPDVVTSIDNIAEVSFRNADDSGDVTETAEHNMPTECIPVDADNIILGADTTEICVGGEVTLSAILDGISSVTDPVFLWYDNAALSGTALVGESVVVTLEETTTYYVVVEADGHCFNTPAASIEITVNPLPTTPTITLTGDGTICEGDVATLTATPGADTYIWYLDGVEISGETANTLDATAPGVYTVAAENAAGCASAESASVTIVVTPRATAGDIEVTGHEDAVCEGSVVSLTASSTTVTDPVFNWYADADLTDLVFTGAILTFNPAGNTTLYVTVQGVGICENAPGEAEVVEVIVNPTPDFTVDGPLNYSIEVNNSVTLPTITAPTATVTWYDNDGQVHTGSETETFDTPGTYTYTAVITEADHCTVTVSVIINVFAEGECPPTYDRIYATDGSDYGVSNLLGIPLGGIDNPADAADGDIDSFSELTEGINALGLLGQTYQTLQWSTSVAAGTPVSVKLGKQFSTANVLGSLRIVAVDASGNAVSTAHSVEPNILNALGGLNVYDYTFTPADGSGQTVAYAGVKVYYQGAVSLLQTARIYEAYYHEIGAVDCGDDEVLDVLHGVENPISGLGIANALIGVTDPENVVDSDEDSYAVMNNVAGVNAQTRLEVRYNTPGLAGDEVHIKMTDPSSLLVVGALESFTIQPYLGDAPVGDPIDETSSILRIELLGGGSEAEVIYTADRPFDRIKILYGGVASVLDQLRVNEITRVVPQLELGDDGDNVFEICEGEDIVIPDPDECTTYLIYDAATGGEVVDITALEAGDYTLYVQTVRFGTCEVGERTEIEVTVNALPVAPVIADQEICQEPVDTDVSYDVTALPDHTLNYYDSETATTPLADIPVVNSAVAGVYTVYVSQFNDDTGCEGPRVAVSIAVVAVPAPVLTELDQIFCEIDMPTVADLNTDGATGDVVWYTEATGGTPLAADAALTAGTYYAAQVGDDCESVDRTEVTVTITETPAPVLTELEQIFCEIDMPTVADLNTDGATGDVVWYTEATGGTPLAADAALTAGTYYAAQMGDDCESVDRTEVTVTITETPAPVLTELEQIFCEIDMPTVADLNTDGATGDVVWYTTATGGTPLAADAALTAGTYYAAQMGEDCESVDRTEVTVTITETPAPVLTELDQIFCEIDMPTVADLNTDGATGEVVWYTEATGGTPLADTDALTAGTYYAAQVGDDCESVERTEVTVTITETPAPVLTELDQIFCEIDMPTVADLNTDGATGDVVWYTEATGGTPLAADAALTAGTYYAAQVGDDCESVDRTEVTVTITETPAPVLTELEQIFCEIDMPTVADLDTDGADGDVIWYSAATGGTPLADDAALTAGTYYAAQVGDDCESVERTEVAVTITETPAPSLTELEQVFCEIDMPTVADLNTDGADGDVVWYSAATGGTPLADDAALTAGTYYAAQVGDDCESVERTEVTVTITETPAPTLDELEQVFCEIDGATVSDLDTDGADGDVIWYSAATGGTPLADNAALTAGTYYAAQVGDDCESVERTEVTVTITETPAPTIDNAAPEFCETDNTTLADLPVVGNAIKWYASATSTDALPETTVLEDGVTYYATQMGDDCESAERLAVTPVIVDCTSLLSITKTADDDRVQAGESTSFTLTITNDGPAVIASGEVISLTERPGDGVTITGYEVTSGNGTADGSGNTATVTTSEAIAVGGTIVVTVTADVAADAGETITNGITVWGPDKDPETDPEDDEDDTPPIPVDQVSNLSINKVADDERVISGGTTSFTVTVTNNGPATIAVGKTIAVEERPSDGVTITGYEVTSGNATVSGTGNSSQLTTTAAIEEGGTITFTVSADVTAPAESTISNGIAVWGPDKDPGTDEEDDEDETPEIPVDRPYTLSIEKVADQSLVTAGESTTFTVTVTNNGPLDIEADETIILRERPGTGVTITGYEIISGAATVSGTGDEATLTTTGVVGVGATITVRIAAEVEETATGTITNGITVWGPDRDPDTDDPDDEDDTDPIPVDATLHIPNVFTPNGDGLNDRFVIKNLLQYQGRELIVVNRWGNQVYKSNNYNNDWDGGSLAEGTYYYILRYRNGGEWKTAKGPVAIIRVTNR